jgi:hypothetical protein
MTSTLPDPASFEEAPFGWISSPARYIRDPAWRGWYQDGRKLRHVKASKAFVWPKDGKNGSFRGRIRDIFNNEGPDMYVAFGARKTDCVSNRPRRSQWAEHAHLHDPSRPFSFSSQKFAPWTRNGMLGGRDHGESYGFRTREYTKPHLGMWTDAIWQPEPYKNSEWNSYPQAWRGWDGQWFQDAQYLPQALGGNVSNEFGRGIPFHHLPPHGVR